MKGLLSALRERNPNLVLHDVSSHRFARYGGRVEDGGLSPLCVFVKEETAVPAQGNVYVPSVAEAEALPAFARVEEVYYGGVAAQMGYCNGVLGQLMGLEYHMGSEFLFAATPLVLLLGCLSDMEAGALHTSRIEAFLLGEGDMVELYGTTLHHAPAAALTGGFQCGVALPRGTNLPLDTLPADAPLLRARNKWLVAHVESEDMIAKGVCPLLYGPVLAVKAVAL